MEFGTTVQQLSDLMKHRSAEAVTKLRDLFTDSHRLVRSLRSDESGGISSKDAQLLARSQVFGSNIIPEKKPQSFLSLVIDALKDPTLIILEVAAVISLGLSFYDPGDGTSAARDDDHEQEAGFIESAAILVAVFAVALVTALNDYAKEKQFRGLRSQIQKEHRVSVMRDGQVSEIMAHDLLVGDICLIKAGDSIPADGILLSSHDLHIDESSLTGESDQVEKGIENDPVLLSGTLVMEGSGKMIVTAVGVNSQAGIIYMLLQRSSSDGDASGDNRDHNHHQSILQQKLNSLSTLR